ncbi:MAG: AtpZ/AtpI family protein [Armatimonadetes bacterium]|nr:AtpZ/AtpI family protein [Armatimonadota bacterium]
MADDKPTQSEDETPSLSVPSHDPLPPPPQVTYTRPTLGRSAPSSPRPSDAPGGATDDAGGGSPAIKLGAGMAAGTTFVASVVAGLFIGQWVDRHWGHPGGTPWGTLIFSLLGVAAGFLNLFRVLAATDRTRGKK